MADRPTIQEGDCNEAVADLLQMLPIRYFDEAITKSVIAYQRSRGLDPDGIVGPQTWGALESNAPPYTPPGLPPTLSNEAIDGICQIAAQSSIARYNWKNRGQAPIGYTKGCALAYANVYRQWQVQYPPAIDMAKANTHNSDKDALSWYAGVFDSLGLHNGMDGVDTLRHLWVLLIGLGMRESSGKHCCGRDTSASNTSSNTAEAGAWQTSYDAHSCSPQFDTLFDAFRAGEGEQPQGFMEVFAESVTCSSTDWQCYGSGNGYVHQDMSKKQPAYAAEVCAITLRNLRKHFGPINRREAEIRVEADEMLRQVQDYVNRIDHTTTTRIS